MREIRTLRCDVEGTGNVAWSRYCDTQTKERANGEHELRPKPARQSSTLPARSRRCNPFGLLSQSAQDCTTAAIYAKVANSPPTPGSGHAARLRHNRPTCGVIWRARSSKTTRSVPDLRGLGLSSKPDG